jgi:hypothetical protein
MWVMSPPTHVLAFPPSILRMGHRYIIFKEKGKKQRIERKKKKKRGRKKNFANFA